MRHAELVMTGADGKRDYSNLYDLDAMSAAIELVSEAGGVAYEPDM